MHMSAEQRINAPPALVWAALNDPDVLRQSIPGCEEIERVGDNELTATVIVKVGPVKAKFRGKVVLSELDPPNGYRITGEGQGGAAGFAKGGAKVTLVPNSDGTLLKYDVDATVGGKLAQIGSRLIDASARKMADDFFTRFNALVSASAEMHGQPLPVPEKAPERGVPPGVWVPLLILLVALLLYVFSRP